MRVSFLVGGRSAKQTVSLISCCLLPAPASHLVAPWPSTCLDTSRPAVAQVNERTAPLIIKIIHTVIVPLGGRAAPCHGWLERR